MRIVVIIFVMVTVMIACAMTIECQTGDGAVKSDKIISQEAYNRVLDILFPRDEPRGDYGLVLRFKPSFHPESQVVIKRGVDKVEVIEYTSLNGNIYSKLNELMSHGAKDDPAELAKFIKVRRKSIQVPYAQIKQWHASFLESFGQSLIAFRKRSEEFDKAGTISVVIDGTFYDLWYGQGVNDMSFSFYDEEVSDKLPDGQLKVVQWMNAVRRDVEKLK
ncbi:MAG TPA: hypothetical protein VE961_22150 [Pyrinomonadaceae bacterium]|nr:hypothetical protein [Pyrinomonadaceae bacterium]